MVISMKEFINLIGDNRFVKSALIIAIGIVLYNLIKFLIHIFIKSGKTPFERKKRNTIVKLLQNIFKYSIFIIVILFVLESYGVNTKNLIAGLGIAGVVLGLALQDTVKDLISGLSIMLDNYFVIGDYVKFHDFTGEVVEFGLKATKIQAFSGEVLIIANRNIDQVVNLSQKGSSIFIKVPTAYEEKEEKVAKVLNEAIKEIIATTQADESSKYLGIENLGDSSIEYLVKIHCPQDSQFAIKRESLMIIKKHYDKNNIKIPYNQIEVHNGYKI